eukprot:scaffold14912_cov308-Ochromonas_danica.AAC.2
MEALVCGLCVFTEQHAETTTVFSLDIMKLFFTTLLELCFRWGCSLAQVRKEVGDLEMALQGRVLTKAVKVR